MLSRARLDAYRADVDALGDKAVDYCVSLLRAMRDESPGATVAELRDAAISAIEDTLSIFGDQAGLLACDLFDALAAESDEKVRSGVHNVIDADQVESRVRYFARKLVLGDADGFDMDVRDLTRYLIKRDAFENMLRSCERNDLRYARVPSGRETCGFCLMLASRGFVYRSEKTAEGSHGFHNHCDCVVVPGFKGLDQAGQIEGYDPDGMAGRVGDCMDTIGGTDGLHSLWRSMSKEERARYKGKSDSDRFERFKTAQLAREIETRDWKWLHSGIKPEITFTSKEVRIRASEAELRTASRLVNHGVSVRFIQDYEVVIGEDGIKRKVGLPDLLNGIEIKTLGGSGNAFGAVDNYLSNAVKKRGLKTVVIDNVESQHIGDDRLIVAARKVLQDYRQIPRLILLLKDGRMLEIK